MEKSVSVLAIAVTLVTWGCYVPLHDQTPASSDRTAIALPVIAHMVVHADEDAALVRFVDLYPRHLEQLRKLCGPRFRILPIEEAESRGGVLRVKGNNREGVHISVEVTDVHGQHAEAGGAYIHEGSVTGFNYKLEYSNGAWRIASSEFDSAS